MNDQEGFSFDKEIPSRKFKDDPTPPYKLHRKDGMDTSKDAAHSVKVNEWEQKVLDFIRTFGRLGCISDECIQHFGPEKYATVTARYKQLEEKGLIVRPPGFRRNSRKGASQAVMIAAEYLEKEKEDGGV